MGRRSRNAYRQDEESEQEQENESEEEQEEPKSRNKRLRRGSDKGVLLTELSKGLNRQAGKQKTLLGTQSFWVLCAAENAKSEKQGKATQGKGGQ